MEQVLTKKLKPETLEENVTPSLNEFSKLFGEIVEDVKKTQIYHSQPFYDVPESYRLPSIAEEVEELLASDAENNFPSEIKLKNPKCRVCAGMHLEPMVIFPSLFLLSPFSTKRMNSPPFI